MNRIFRIVRNRTTGKCTVASELAASRGKRGTLDRAVASTLLMAAPLLGVAGAAGAAPLAELTGSNGQMWHGSPCDTLTVPSTCPNENRVSQADVSGAVLTFPYNHLLVGANLSNTNDGPAVSGNLSITDGGVVNATRLYVGYEGNTSGTVTVSGEGSRWNGGGTMSVGNYGTGAMTISDGGYAKGSNIYVGNFEGGSGDLLVSGISAAGTRSTLQANSSLFVGDNNDYTQDQPTPNAGNGVLTVADGGLVSSTYGSIGGRTGSGTVTVQGVNANGQASQWNLGGSLTVGNNSKGTLNVIDGAEVNNTTAIVGYYGDGEGTVNVANGGKWTNTGALTVGFLANGAVNIDAGGTVQSASATIGGYNDAIGAVKVNGEGALWQNDGDLSVGNAAAGTVEITNGGKVAVGGSSTIGVYAGTSGSVLVSGEGSQFDAGDLMIGVDGQGTMVVADGAKVAASSIVLGADAWSSGTLKIGNGGLAGTVDTASITGGDGWAAVQFDHGDDTDFASTLGGSLSVDKAGAGTTTLSSANDYTGFTNVESGVLRAGVAGAFSAASAHTVQEGATLSLNGFDQTIASLNNVGTVSFHDAETSAGTTLTIAGNYYGDGGTLVMNTALGDDTSATDKLVVQGDTGGNSFVQVRNAGGAGAATDNGIELIQVGGASDGVFQLQGRAVAGLYDYQLFQGGKNTPDDGNWYLRSEVIPTPPVDPPVDPVDPVTPPVDPVDPVTPPVDPVDPVTPPVDPVDPVTPPVDPVDPVTPPVDPVDPVTPPVQPEQPDVPTPVLRPEPAAYLGNQVAALRMFQNTMHDRVGEPGLGAREDGKGYTSWARVQSRKLDAGTVGGQIDINTDASVMQIGAEKQFAVGEGRIHAGVMGGYGRATTQGTSTVSDHHATGEVKGRNVGVYGTWFQNADGPEGLYVDGVAQYGRFDNTVKGDYLGTEQYNSTVRSASLEAGYAFKVHEGEHVGVYVEPQAQVIYSDFSSDDVREQNGTLVQSQTAGGTTTRLGARVYTRPLGKEHNRVQPYAAVNWWSGGNNATIAMDGERLSRDLPNNIVELKTGAQLELGKGWSGWGEISQQRGSYGFKDTGVQMGVKLSW